MAITLKPPTNRPKRQRLRVNSWKELPTERRPFMPQGETREYLYAHEQEVLLCGPTGTGKSRTALEKLNIICSKYPKARCAMLRRTRRSLTQSGMVTFENHVLPYGFPCYFHGTNQEYRYPDTGAVIVVGGLDQASKVMSTEFDVIYIMEATEIEEEQWEKCLTRLRNGRVPYQQLIADCNPDKPDHWLKKRCDRGATRLINNVLEDNPIFFDPIQKIWTPEGESYRAVLNNLTGVRGLRLREGKWAAAEGIIYEGWNPSTHLFDAEDFNAMLGRKAGTPFYIPPDWPRFLAVDFGYRNPLVVQWWALDHDYRLYLYRELYHTGMLVEDVAPIIAELSAGEQLLGIITDHDAEDRATLERHLGAYTTAATKDVSRGIQAVQSRLRTDGTGRPRLMVYRDALVQPDTYLQAAKLPLCTAQEFDGYVWDTKNGRAVTEVPLKLNDHGMDALRYAVMFIEEGLHAGGEDVTGRF